MGLGERMSLAWAMLKGLPYASGSPGAGSIVGNLLRLLPGSQYDYERGAGPLHKNSLVLAGIKWAGNVFPEARPCVRREQKSGKYEVIPGHPMTMLLRRPSSYWDYSILMQAGILSDAVAGNVYYLKCRNDRTGIPQSLEWLPHWTITPRWPKDESEFISHYDYKPGGTTIYRIEKEDIIHIRNGVDPDNPRLGLSPLAAVYREVASDNEAATYAAAILRNMGIPGMVLKPSVNTGGAMTRVNAEGASEMKATFREEFGGDNRGGLWILKAAMDLVSLSFSPRDMDLSVVRKVPEERVAAALGIPAIVLGFGAGLARSTFSNMREAREAAYESCIVPMQQRFASAFDSQLLHAEPCYKAQDGDSFWFDISEVRALQEDQTALYNRASVAYKAGIITRAEAKQMVGLVAGPKDDVYYTDVAAAANAANAGVPTGDSNDPTEKSLPAGYDQIPALMQRITTQLDEMPRAA